MGEVVNVYCQDGGQFLLPKTRPSSFTRMIDAHFRAEAAANRVVQMPSFFGAQSIGVFSDYAGDHGNFSTYTFLFANLGALSSFRESVIKARHVHGLHAKKEIAFKSLQNGPMRRVLPDFLKAADQVPGLLFTLVADNQIESVVDVEAKTAEEATAQLSHFGFRSWLKPKQRERLARILHCVSYWLSLFGRKDMKVFWQTDNDSIFGPTSNVQEFREVYGRALSLFNCPEFEVAGFARSFDSEPDRLFSQDALSVADLVAGAMAAYLSDSRAEAKHASKHKEVGQILSLLDHQGVFLKKLNLILERCPDGSVQHGFLNVNPLPCSREWYKSVVSE